MALLAITVFMYSLLFGVAISLKKYFRRSPRTFIPRNRWVGADFVPAWTQQPAFLACLENFFFVDGVAQLDDGMKVFPGHALGPGEHRLGNLSSRPRLPLVRYANDKNKSCAHAHARNESTPCGSGFDPDHRGRLD
jgi:hypothetical protein